MEVTKINVKLVPVERGWPGWGRANNEGGGREGDPDLQYRTGEVKFTN